MNRGKSDRIGSSLLQILLIPLFLAGCTGNDRYHYKYQRPEKINDGIEVGTLEEVDLDTALVIKAVDKIRNGRFGEVHSLLVFKDGRLVLEEYFKGHDYQWDAPGHHGQLLDWNRDMLHCIHSDSKSITSLCIGIAIDKGFIKNVHQSIFDYLPGSQYLKTKENGYVTIEHLLTMTSGLQWAEWNAPLSSKENDQVGIWFHEKGPVDFVLSRPMVSQPGTHFTYSGGNIEILGVMLENATGMALDDFSKKYLFEPLGIDTSDWFVKYPTGEIHAAAGLKLTPRSMLKVGMTMLADGMRNGKQIVPVQWVEKSMNPYRGNEGIRIPGEDLGKLGYSYTWWTKKISIKGKNINWYSANGWGGQKIIILPEIRTVIVFTGANYTSKVREFSILEDYIFPAFK